MRLSCEIEHDDVQLENYGGNVQANVVVDINFNYGENADGSHDYDYTIKSIEINDVKFTDDMDNKYGLSDMSEYDMKEIKDQIEDYVSDEIDSDPQGFIETFIY